MRPVVVAASLVAALSFSVPSVASAQQPERAPRPAPAPVEPPPSEAAPRDVAVPRSAAPRAETPRVETPPRSETPRVDSPPTNAEQGNRRRAPVSEAAPASAPSAGVSDSQGAERRGAVRRPPSDGGRGTSGTPRDRAVVRTGPPPRDWNGDRDRHRVYYYPSYYSYGRYYDPYYYSGFHLGYLAYSPWGWMPSFYGYPYGYGGGYAYSGYGYDIGRLRIKVQPRDAEVYVDGYFAGNVDDFDGTFQSLKLETGGYRIEIRKPGFETLQFDVHVQPDRTITYRGQMRVTP